MLKHMNIRPRIFSLMLTAFALVIVLGIGGMISFFGLAVANVQEQRWQNWPAESVLQRSVTDELIDYYTTHGSWNDLPQALGDMREHFPSAPRLEYTLVDEQGRVVITTEPEIVVGERLEESRNEPSVPVEVADKPIGTLFFHYNPASRFAPDPAFSFADSPWSSRLTQGLISAALALAAILLGMAAFFSSRISRPLRHLTSAAHSLATGEMHARVQHSAIREIDELGRTFNAMADSLVQADQQRRQLTADVAHELRTPLSIIKGRLEGIQDGVYTATPEQIDGLLGEVSLLERLIDDLRLLALSDAGQLPLYIESVDPAHLLHDTIRSFAHQAEGRKVALQLSIDSELGDVAVDPQRITQVLGNLVGNALRHTPAGGSVKLCAWIDRQDRRALQLVIAVSDTGAGIALDDLPYVFERFWRADRSRTRSSGGAGLGLAIARRIIEAHGGRIWADSAIGQGTTVTFSLPLER